MLHVPLIISVPDVLLVQQDIRDTNDELVSGRGREVSSPNLDKLAESSSSAHWYRVKSKIEWI